MENTLIFDHFKPEELNNISKIESISEMIYEIDEIYFTNYSQTRNEMLKSKIMEIIKILDDNLQNTNICKYILQFVYNSRKQSDFLFSFCIL